MIYENLIGHSATPRGATREYDIDVGGILRRLTLFEHYILISTRLKEIPAIVGRLGLENTIKLIESNALTIYLDPTTTTQTGQTTVFNRNHEKVILPLLSYRFNTLKSADRKHYISGCFRESIDPIKAPIKELKKLKKAILSQIKESTNELDLDVETQLENDLTQKHTTIKTALSRRILENHGVNVSKSEICIEITQTDAYDFLVESNIIKKLNLQPEEAHKTIEQALLDIAGLNRRIAQMKHFDALSGFNENDLPIFESKIDFLVKHLDPSNQEERAKRVFTTVDLPDFSDVNYNIDIEKFLELRNSNECQEFRKWLTKIDQASDQEILEQVSGLRSKLSTIANSKSGRALRFLTSTAIGSMDAGLILGPAASILDSYLFKNVLKESPIATFISHMYPKLFTLRQ